MELKDKQILRFKSKYTVTESCWEWVANKNQRGYGIFSLNDKSVGAHRVSFLISKGEIPIGLCILHSCDNPSCVNPEHLFLGTHQDNMDDRSAKGRVPKEDKHPNAKLTTEQVLKIRHDGRYAKLIAHEYGISKDQVNKIRTFRSWKFI